MTEISREYSEDADKTFEKAKEACKGLGLAIVKEDATSRRIQVSTGWSAFSWGETMHIVVSQQKDGATVTVDSKPKLWFNLPAWERARRNAQALLDELQKRVETKFCRECGAKIARDSKYCEECGATLA